MMNNRYYFIRRSHEPNRWVIVLFHPTSAGEMFKYIGSTGYNSSDIWSGEPVRLNKEELIRIGYKGPYLAHEIPYPYEGE